MSYSRTGVKVPQGHLRLIFNTDSGYEDGSWRHGASYDLQMMLTEATKLEIRTYQVRGDGGLEAVTLNSNEAVQVPLNAVIRGRVIGLHEDSYAWGEESEDADNSCDFGASVDGEPRSDGSNSDDPWEFSF